MAIADCSRTVQEEQRKGLEIRKLNNFYSKSCSWKSWPQTGDCPAAGHSRWEITTQSLCHCSFSGSLAAWSAPLICLSAGHLSLNWQVQFNCSYIHTEVVNTNGILDDNEADINLYEVFSADKYELERFYWTSILNISVKLVVAPGRHVKETLPVGDLFLVRVAVHFSFQQNCKQQKEYLLLLLKQNLWNVGGEKETTLKICF